MSDTRKRTKCSVCGNVGHNKSNPNCPRRNHSSSSTDLPLSQTSVPELASSQDMRPRYNSDANREWANRFLNDSSISHLFAEGIEEDILEDHEHITLIQTNRSPLTIQLTSLEFKNLDHLRRVVSTLTFIPESCVVRISECYIKIMNEIKSNPLDPIWWKKFFLSY